MRRLILEAPRGADAPLAFHFPGLDLTGFTARLVLAAPSAPIELDLELERCDGPELVSTGWLCLPRALTASLPPGSQTRFELRLIEPRGTLRIAARGVIRAIGGLDHD